MLSSFSSGLRSLSYESLGSSAPDETVTLQSSERPVDFLCRQVRSMDMYTLPVQNQYSAHGVVPTQTPRSRSLSYVSGVLLWLFRRLLQYTAVGP